MSQISPSDKIKKFSGPLILDGTSLRDSSVKSMREMILKNGKKPLLAIIQIGKLASSNAYIDKKKEFAEKIGALTRHIIFPDTVLESELIAEIEKLNKNSSVHGIILQLPIPANLDKQTIIDAVDILKDVDGLTSENKRRFEAGETGAIVPATARGVLSLLKAYGISIRGKKVTIIGRSALVGAPIATLLRREGASVTVCHSQSADIPGKSRSADILVVAVGKPSFVTKDFVSPGQVVIDVGINSVIGEKLEEEISKRKLVGDVDFNSVKDIVGAISPVPGGVGPMTVLSLFENLLDISKIQRPASG